MSVRFMPIAAHHPIDVVTPGEFYLMTKDTDEPEPDGTLILTADNGGDGIAVTGTPTELAEWLARAQRALKRHTGGANLLYVDDPADRESIASILAAAGA